LSIFANNTIVNSSKTISYHKEVEILQITIDIKTNLIIMLKFKDKIKKIIIIKVAKE